MIIKWIQERRLRHCQKKRDEAAEEVRKLKFQKALLEDKLELPKKIELSEHRCEVNDNMCYNHN